MSALRIILLLLPQARDRDFVKTTIRKLAPPIVTMLSGPKEIQYITLRNVSLIVQKRPKVLENQYRVFFCKYNDPLYIKMEKLDVLYKLSNERNIEELLNEFKECAIEVDIPNPNSNPNPNWRSMPPKSTSPSSGRAST